MLHERHEISRNFKTKTGVHFLFFFLLFLIFDGMQKMAKRVKSGEKGYAKNVFEISGLVLKSPFDVNLVLLLFLYFLALSSVFYFTDHSSSSFFT